MHEGTPDEVTCCVIVGHAEKWSFSASFKVGAMRDGIPMRGLRSEREGEEVFFLYPGDDTTMEEAGRRTVNLSARTVKVGGRLFLRYDKRDVIWRDLAKGNLEVVADCVI